MSDPKGKLQDMFKIKTSAKFKAHMTCILTDKDIQFVDSKNRVEKVGIYTIGQVELKKNKPNTILIRLTTGDKITMTNENSAIIQEWLNTINRMVIPRPKFSLDSFDLLCTIGRGTSGIVTLVREKATGELFALKSIPKLKLMTPKEVQRAISERDALMMAPHPFITQLYGTFQTKSCLYYVMQFISGGDLFFHLRNHEEFSINQIKYLMAELVCAITHMHELGIIYRDLKPENILIGKDGHIKLTDFGLAKELVQNSHTDSICGSNEYMAPEIVRRKSYGFGVDWWALGVLLFVLCCHHYPFSHPNISNLFTQIEERKVVVPSSVDPDAKDLILQLLERDPEKRLGDDKIRSHPFFDGIDWDDVIALKLPLEFIPFVSTPDSVENFDEVITSRGIIQTEMTESDSEPFMHVSDFSCFRLDLLNDPPLVSPV